MMVYRGHVENGLIRLEDAPVLPEGVEVEVRLLADSTCPAGEEKHSQRVRCAARFRGQGGGVAAGCFGQP